jgi:hypothetical protein
MSVAGVAGAAGGVTNSGVGGTVANAGNAAGGVAGVITNGDAPARANGPVGIAAIANAMDIGASANQSGPAVIIDIGTIGGAVGGAAGGAAGSNSNGGLGAAAAGGVGGGVGGQPGGSAGSANPGAPAAGGVSPGTGVGAGVTITYGGGHRNNGPRGDRERSDLAAVAAGAAAAAYTDRPSLSGPTPIALAAAGTLGAIEGAAAVDLGALLVRGVAALGGPILAGVGLAAAVVLYSGPAGGPDRVDPALLDNLPTANNDGGRDSKKLDNDAVKGAVGAVGTVSGAGTVAGGGPSVGAPGDGGKDRKGIEDAAAVAGGVAGPTAADQAPVPGATPGRETKGRSTLWESSGGSAAADKDFDSMNPHGVRELEDGTRIGSLDDGRTIVVRPDSSDGRPTLEIQDGKNKTKIRYDN